jgi:hypothetical protein
MRRVIVQSKQRAAERQVGLRRVGHCLQWWMEYGRRRALKRIKALRARARSQGALARWVWGPWVAFVTERRRVRRLARAVARQRAERRARRGLRALWAVVVEARREMDRQVRAIKRWKVARERHGWSRWQVREAPLRFLGFGFENPGGRMRRNVRCDGGLHHCVCVCVCV